ncbi:MAG: hypothetical protein LBV74_08680 [Tannerella sp.]|jgi:hypothetical protein|nr:hypothetical protein [Tannerella sp.]
MTDWNEMSDKDKDEVKGFFIFWAMILFFVLFYLYGDYETKYIKEHGVWTILTVSDSYGRRVNYRFRLNNQTYRDKANMTIKKIEETEEAGNRLFMVVIPTEIKRHRIYGVVPKWFKLDAPPKGWKRCPTNKELYDIMAQDYRDRFSEKEVSDDDTGQNQIHEVEIAKEDDEYARKDRERWNNLIIINSILLTIFSVILVLYRNKKVRYIREHGVWTILTVTKKEATDSVSHKKVYYIFQLNNRTYTGSVTLRRKKAESANRFFIMVVPNEAHKRKIYGNVPEWFTSDAPSEGWEKHPTENELREMMKQG